MDTFGTSSLEWQGCGQQDRDADVIGVVQPAVVAHSGMCRVAAQGLACGSGAIGKMKGGRRLKEGVP